MVDRFRNFSIETEGVLDGKVLHYRGIFVGFSFDYPYVERGIVDARRWEMPINVGKVPAVQRRSACRVRSRLRL